MMKYFHPRDTNVKTFPVIHNDEISDKNIKSFQVILNDEQMISSVF